MHFTDPLPQDPAYHDFADVRSLYGIPHFWNVVTNLPYFLIGVIGCFSIAMQRPAGILPGIRNNYLFMYLGALLVGLGSSWYHLQPSNQSLLWDRLPLAITFMAFTSIILGEYINVRMGRYLLGPLLVIGIASVIYWHLGELSGRGDLRPYAIVQFLPILLLPLIMLQRPCPYESNQWTWWLMACYLLAKVFEMYDMEVFTTLKYISGHSLKHLVSATGLLILYIGLFRRRLHKDPTDKNTVTMHPAAADK